MRRLYEFLTMSDGDDECLLCKIGEVMDMSNDNRQRKAALDLARDISDNMQRLYLVPKSVNCTIETGKDNKKVCDTITIDNDDGAEVFSCKRYVNKPNTYIWDGPSEIITAGIKDMLDEYDITGKYCDEHGNVTDKKPDEGTDAWICATDTCK